MASGENKTLEDLACFGKFKHCFLHSLVFEVFDCMKKITVGTERESFKDSFKLKFWCSNC